MLNQSIIPELQNEAANTRKMLERVPQDQFQSKPHVKSMSLVRLATHIAELPSWIPMIINSNELDLSKMNYKPPVINNTADLTELLDRNLKQATDALKTVSDDTLMGTWTLRNADHVIFSLPRIAVIRSMAMNHVIHHRGQLSVYLRLHNVAVPGMYGPSADEMTR